MFNPQSTIYSFDSVVLSHSHIHVNSLKFIRRLTPSTSEFEGYVLTPNNSILSNLSVSLMPVSQLTDSASLPPSALLLLISLARRTLVIHVSTTSSTLSCATITYNLQGEPIGTAPVLRFFLVILEAPSCCMDVGLFEL